MLSTEVLATSVVLSSPVKWKQSQDLVGQMRMWRGRIYNSSSKLGEVCFSKSNMPLDKKLQSIYLENGVSGEIEEQCQVVLHVHNGLYTHDVMRYNWIRFSSTK